MVAPLAMLRALLLVAPAMAAQNRLGLQLGAGKNPIRKVVTMMQDMVKEIEAEGDKEKELYDKFMCFCSAGTGDLEASLAKAKQDIEDLSSKLESESAEKVQIDQELESHKTDRASAQKELSEATSLRDKQKADNEAKLGDQRTNLDAMSGAISAVKKGLGGASFVQIPQKNLLKSIIEGSKTIDDYDRNAAVSFLLQQKTSEASTGADQILGIMSQLKDEMADAIKKLTEDEAAAAETFASLKASKEQEIALASQAIESKTARSGELAVSTVQAADGLEDAKKEAADSEKFIADLKTQCESKTKEFDARTATRNDEITAVNEAIGILNNDDALETFKKSSAGASSALQFGQLPQLGLSLLQRGSARAGTAARALARMSALSRSHPSAPGYAVALYQLKATIRQQGQELFRMQAYDKVIKTVDQMIVTLGKAQDDEDHQKEFCTAELDKSGEEKAVTETKLKELETAISEMSDAVSQLTDDISTLQSEIVNLDKTVAQATEQRKEEHAEYTSQASMNEIAIGLVRKARNRMAKFYTPDAPPVLLQVAQRTRRELADMEVAPPEAPETFSGEVEKNSKSAGVLAMMDTIIKDIDMGMQEAKHDEATSQKDYVELMKESKETRKQNTESIADKESQKAQLTEKLAVLSEKNDLTDEELAGIQTTLAELHGTCDYLLENYEARTQARKEETDGLNEAKAMLAGAEPQ